MLHCSLPSLNAALGLYIPLIVVNCIILGRAESFASKNPVIPSIFDGLGMGFGFTVALTAIGMVRELLGAGEHCQNSLHSQNCNLTEFCPHSDLFPAFFS